MAVDKRLRYFNGQFLQAADFIDEQTYHVDRLRGHLGQLHTPGIAGGLEVAAAVGATQAVVAPGTAIDAEGRQVVLAESRNLPLGGHAGETVLVLISYDEQASDPASAGTGSETRWHERPDVELVPDDGSAPGAGTHVRLARLTIGGDGRVSAAPDESVRVRAGGQLGDEVTARKLSLRREGVDPSLWPAVTSGAPGRLDVAGGLNVTGAGTIAGRNVGADGAALDAHVARTDNPHVVTPAQIGALLASDYAFGRRKFDSLAFGSASNDGDTKTSNVGFPPRFLLVFSGCQASIGGNQHGGPTVGFVDFDLDGFITKSTTHLVVVRKTVAPFIVVFGNPPVDRVFSAEFWDETFSPQRSELVSVDVTGVSGNTVTFKYNRRRANSSHNPVGSFSIDMQLIFFG